jgi:hypothetical protein
MGITMGVLWGCWMEKNIFWGPLPQWNNFTVPELKEILMHCEALEQLGIAQDADLVKSVKRDIELRS